jgi:hypothetical protein
MAIRLKAFSALDPLSHSISIENKHLKGDEWQVAREVKKRRHLSLVT